jgi:hypothetical protein
MDIILYYINENKFTITLKKDILDNLYEGIAKIWFNKEEIENFTNSKIIIYKRDNNNFIKTNDYLDTSYFDKENLNKLRIKISKLQYKIPLYDIYSDKLYLIHKENVYDRIMYNYYRLPTRKNNDFLKNYNLKTLEKTYIIVFYYYSNKVGKNLTKCIRPSFLSHLKYIKPYYSRDEIINLALNLKLIKYDDKYYNKDEINKLCTIIRNNDINRTILLDHQKYIVENNGIHKVMYYSLNGAYFMNSYLRNLNSDNHKNIILENNIKQLWTLIKNAPEFDKSYQLYRFINIDRHLNFLKIGDTYVEKSFISTTRNPFYNISGYEFGYILIKIKIPSGVKGVALCIETFSNFQAEEEIILPPLSHLKLISKNEDAEYYHIDKKFNENITTRYEFEFIKSDNIIIKSDNYLTQNIDIKTIDIFKIDLIDQDIFEDKIQYFIKNYTNNNLQFSVNIDNKLYTFVIEWYNSTSVYSNYYYLKAVEGISIYCQNPTNLNIALFLEIGTSEIHVNYYNKYAYTDNYLNMESINTIKFIAKIGHIFGINNIYIHQKYQSCQDFITDEFKYTEFKKRVLETYLYRKDYYDYLTRKIKRFDNKFNITAKFFYYQLDELFNTPIIKMVSKNDLDELYQIYQEYIKNIKIEKDNLADFYIYIIQKRSEYISLFEKKSIRIFKTDNPFMIDYYFLSAFNFLFNNNIIIKIPKVDIIPENKQDTENKQNNKNNYRINRYRL